MSQLNRLYVFVGVLAFAGAAAGVTVSSQSEFLRGEFNLSSADRDANSGDLGIGYLNGSAGDNLTGFWRLDSSVSGSGGNVTGYAENQTNGTTEGGVTTGVEGVFSTSAFSFDGSDDYVDLPQDSVPAWYSTEPSVTLSAWFKTSESGVVFGNAGGDTPSASDGWVPGIYIDDSGRVRASAFWHGDSATTNSAGGFADGEWHHVVATFGSGNETVYVDGERRDRRTGLSQNDYNSGTYSYFIGAGRWESWPGISTNVGWFNGSIDEVKVYNQMFKASEARELYFEGKPFSADYNYTVNTTSDRKWNDLAVNASVPFNTSLTAKFEALNSSGEVEASKLFDVTSGYGNYTLDLQQTEDARVSFNGTSDNETLTWEVENFTVYSTQPPSVDTPEITAPVEEGTEVNVTVNVSDDSLAVESVVLNLTDPAGNVELRDAKMNERSGDTYFFEYLVQNDTDNDGTWFANVTANNSQGAEASNGSTFEVLKAQNPLYRNLGQESDVLDPLQSNKLYAEGFDNFNLSYALLETNETGKLENKTRNYSSPLQIGKGGEYVWANFTWDNDSFSGDSVEWRIWFNDSAGNYNATELRSFNVRDQDLEPPEITITSPENASTNDSTPFINASANEDISSWLYNVDDGANITFDSSTELGQLSDGKHNVTVWANDTADNFGNGTRFFSVDTVPPESRDFGDNSTGAIEEGQLVNISAEMRDANSGSFKAVLATNRSGSFENYTSAYGSPEVLSNSTVYELVDFSWSDPDFFGTLGYRIYFRDAAGNWNATEVSTVFVEERVSTGFAGFSELEDWIGFFNATSASRQDDSGNLGLGYRNGEEGDDLLGFWRLDRAVSGTDGSVKDYSGENNTGATKDGVATGQNGVFRTNAYKFDGSQTYVSVPNSSVPDWEQGYNISISAWFRTSSDGVIFGQQGEAEPGSNNGWIPSLYVGEQGRVHTSLFYHGSTITTKSTASFNDGDWHHAVATYSDGTEKLYVDGSKVSESTGLSQDGYSDSYYYFIGSGQWDTWPGTSTTIGWFDGSIDEVRVYNRTIAPEEVSELYFYGDTGRFRGDFNRTFNVPSGATLEKQLVEFSGADSTENTTYVTVNSTTGGSTTVQPTGEATENYTVDGGTGGEAIVNINFSSISSVTTPIIERLELYASSLTYEVNATLEASDGSKYEGAELSFIDNVGNVVSRASTTTADSLVDSLARGVNYTVRTSAPVYDRRLDARINGFSPEADERARSQIVRNYSESNILPEGVTKAGTFYAFNDTFKQLEGAELTLPRLNDEPPLILHCTDWDFSARECIGDRFEVNQTEEYDAKVNSTHVEFEVDGFDAFGLGNGNPLPNITDIRIYNTTNLQSDAEREVGGDLITSGLNTTFSVNQSRRERQYRFEFKIVNDGTLDWDIQDSDELYHDGLNDSWEVTKVWYNITGAGRDYNGADFTGTNVTWFTGGNAGTLEAADNNDTMYAKYLVNITTEKNQSFDQRFEVNDTSTSSGSFDEHRFELSKFGFLNVTFSQPPNDTLIPQNFTFDAEANVSCEEGFCGDTSANIRYNQSSEADTLVPEGTGKPFYVETTNIRQCGKLAREEVCSISWSVNATAENGTSHLLDVNASSTDENVDKNESADKLIRVEKVTEIDLRYDTVDFGLVRPGEVNQSALENSAGGYNLSVPSYSKDVQQLWVNGTDLETGGYVNPTTGENYRIPVQNLSIAKKNMPENETQLRDSYLKYAEDVPSGTNFTTYYFVDTPEGIKTSEYNGTVTFKANETA